MINSIGSDSWCMGHKHRCATLFNVRRVVVLNYFQANLTSSKARSKHAIHEKKELCKAHIHLKTVKNGATCAAVLQIHSFVSSIILEDVSFIED